MEEYIDGLSIVMLRDTRRLSHRAIMAVTHGPYAHCGMVYTCSQSKDLSVFVECVATPKKENERPGLSFPVPLASLSLYSAAHADCYECIFIELPVTSTQAIASWRFYKAIRHSVRYAGAQLLSNWLSCRSGLLLSRRRSNPYRWTCSEAAVRLTPLQVQHDIFKIGDFRFDEYVPSGRFPASIHRLATAAGLPSVPV